MGVTNRRGPPVATGSPATRAKPLCLVLGEALVPGEGGGRHGESTPLNRASGKRVICSKEKQGLL